MHVKQLLLILLVGTLFQIPFLNKAFHIDSDMMVHTARQMAVSPLNPPPGEYGKHMVLHNYTAMPHTTVFFRNPHPPLIPLLLAPVVRLFEETELPVHIFFLQFYLLTVMAGYFLFSFYLTSKRLFFVTCLWAFSPALFVNSQNAMYDVPATFFIVMTLGLFIAGYRSHRNGYFLLSGMALGLGALTKMTVLPLYPACALFLLLKKEWKPLFFWLAPSLLLPSAWAMHNLIVFGKIQYLSTGHLHPTIGDMRYRFERIVAYLGGVLTLPVFWYRLFYKEKMNRELLLIVPVAAWSLVLVLFVNIAPSMAFFYFLFAYAGTVIIVHCSTIPLWKGVMFIGKRDEALLLSFFFILYLSMILFLPLASVRFLIPLIPIVLLLFMSILPDSGNAFSSVVITATLLLTVALSVADAQLCDSDRKLPSYLTGKGYTGDKTWYFGRLSFDYYLFKAGFKNFKVSRTIPSQGEFFIDETYPGDYPVYRMLEKHTGPSVPVDTIRFHHFPVRTIGNGAGFYGNDRLPYSISCTHAQKEYVIYRVERDSAQPE